VTATAAVSRTCAAAARALGSRCSTPRIRLLLRDLVNRATGARARPVLEILGPEIGSHLALELAVELAAEESQHILRGEGERAVAPVSYVAAARELGIVVGAVLGRVVLGERGLPPRLAGALLIVAGVVLIAGARG